ncbi:MAG: TetR/AcrR family transcriptional regulator [Oscillospiraceae bacterium]|nr:TetR/AcrR family transcriptional regulator [Oscillospiraceae bacterium]
MGVYANPHAEKQESLINAALNVFGRNGYKKASIADITDEAGIAKGTINYYFGSKKNLYLYLAEMCGKSMAESMEQNYDSSITDFFDNIKMMTNIKITLIKNHPAIFNFLASLYMEDDPEVKTEIQEFMANSLALRERWVFADIDMSKFKDDVDTKLINKLLVWAGEGMGNSMKQGFNIGEIEKNMYELFACLDIMKKYFYK